MPALRQALFELGYDDVYHQTSVNVDSPQDTELWIEAMKAKFEDRGKQFEQLEWDQLLGHCMAVTDVPCILFWQELASTYPESKIILTVRDNEEQWYRSFMASSISLLGNLYGDTWLSWLRRRFPFNKQGDNYAQLVLKHEPSYREGYRDFMYGTKDGIHTYVRHNEAIKAYAARNDRDILVFNVKQGWAPLCSFLGVECPRTEFPRLNGRQYFESGSRKIYALVVLNALLSTSLYLFPIGLAAGVSWWFVKQSVAAKIG